MNILSLFDGISVARHALELAGIPVANYWCSEIDANAIKISKKNYPLNHHIGNVCDLKTFDNPVDLLIGGSPCQDLSIAKKGRKGLEGERSGLFYEYIRIRDLVKPKYFILENVASMPSKDRDIISKEMGCEPIMFDASLVSAQIRRRLFWTNIPFDMPIDRGIFLKDILESDVEVNGNTINIKNITNNPKENKGLFLTENNELAVVEAVKKGYTIVENNNSIDLSFSGCKVSTRRGRVGNKAKNLMTSNNIYVYHNCNIRKLTPIECERLQSLPDRYTEGIAITNRYKCLGNAFNADVILHILKNIIVL